MRESAGNSLSRVRHVGTRPSCARERRAAAVLGRASTSSASPSSSLWLCGSRNFPAGEALQRLEYGQEPPARASVGRAPGDVSRANKFPLGRVWETLWEALGNAAKAFRNKWLRRYGSPNAARKKVTWETFPKPNTRRHPLFPCPAWERDCELGSGRVASLQ